MGDIGLDLSGVIGLLTLAIIDFALLIATFVLLLRAVRTRQNQPSRARAVHWSRQREFRPPLGAGVSAAVSIAFTAGMGWIVKDVLSKPGNARFDHFAWTWVFAVAVIWWTTVKRLADMEKGAVREQKGTRKEKNRKEKIEKKTRQARR